MTDLPCVGRDGQTRVFRYDYTQDDLDQGLWHFRVHADPPVSGDCFDFSVREIAEDTVRVEAIAHYYRPEYIAMGIGDAIIPEAAKVLGKIIVSSPSSGGGNVWRTVAATKVWERLRNLGLASYDPNTDTYTYIAN